MEWKPIETLVHDKRCVQVYLADELLGSRIHTMRTGPCATVGCVFAFDAPKATHWRELPEPPKEASDER